MSDRRLVWFTVTLAPVLAWSAVRPHDILTWFLEVAPVLVGVPLMWAVRRRFPLSTLLILLIWVHAVILIVGGHYTYARVPAGEWVGELFGWPRNNYDKLGHLAQGFIPAILTREILVRTSPLEGSRWLAFLVVSVCLAFSALYELIEWGAAELAGGAAEEFLGTQGYAWDTQSDMAFALVGAIIAVITLAGLHDRSMAPWRSGGRKDYGRA